MFEDRKQKENSSNKKIKNLLIWLQFSFIRRLRKILLYVDPLFPTPWELILQRISIIFPRSLCVCHNHFVWNASISLRILFHSGLNIKKGFQREISDLILKWLRESF